MSRWFIRLAVMLLIGCIVVFPASSYAANQSSHETTHHHHKRQHHHHKHHKLNKPTAYVDVAVATLWTSPRILRKVDKPSAGNPVNIWKWKKNMSYKQQVQLSGDDMLETQALYGNKVTVLKRSGTWVKVAVHGQPSSKDHSSYSGWMPSSQLTYTKRFDKKSDDPFVMIHSETTHLYQSPYFSHPKTEISFNTRLPYLGESQDAYHVLRPDGKEAWIKKEKGKVYKSQSDIPKPTGKELVYLAKQFIGLHYLWAGMSGFGFDCSGFTFTLYQSNGMTIPRDTTKQVNGGKHVDYKDSKHVDYKKLKRGDLLYFAHDHGKGTVHHVAMYAGNKKVIQSPNSKRAVELVKLKDEEYFKDGELTDIRRYLSDQK